MVLIQMNNQSNHITDNFDLQSRYQQICEDAAMYQSIAMPSIGFGQKDFGRNPRKSITGGTFDVTSIGSVSESEETKKNERKRINRSKNKHNRINRKHIQKCR